MRRDAECAKTYQLPRAHSVDALRPDASRLGSDGDVFPGRPSHENRPLPYTGGALSWPGAEGLHTPKPPDHPRLLGIRRVGFEGVASRPGKTGLSMPSHGELTTRGLFVRATYG